MPEIKNIDRADMVILYTDIGRGHPSYLDGIIEVLDRSYPDISYLKPDVFSESRGISLAAWKLVRKLYFWGARGGVITSVYGLLRRASGAGEGGILSGILGIHLKKRLSGFDGPVIVAHPILAGILRKQNRVIYQHGELAAPAESMVKGCLRILVPLEETAAAFSEAGIDCDKLVITGQCPELDLVAQSEAAFNRRIVRLAGDGPLTVAMFSSGAYPREHLRKLRLAALSMFHAGHNVYLFLGRSQKVTGQFRRSFGKKRIETASDPAAPARIKVIRSADRMDENRKVAAIFESLDLFVAPAHERTNWAIGLGLPFFMLEPHIGSYAPLNANMALRTEVAYRIETDEKARELGRIVDRMRRESRLATMARNGFGRTQLMGFERCAEIIADLAGKR